MASNTAKAHTHTLIKTHIQVGGCSARSKARVPTLIARQV